MDDSYQNIVYCIWEDVKCEYLVLELILIDIYVTYSEQFIS